MNSILKDHRIVIIDKSSRLTSTRQRMLASSVSWFLRELNAEYPCFDRWLHNKFFNEIHTGKRKIVLSVCHDEIAGLALLKDGLYEKKVCTLRVAEGYRGQGIGSRLMGETFEQLKTHNPLITVSGSRVKDFINLLQRYSFELGEVYNSYYKDGAHEFTYNGYLENKQIAPLPAVTRGVNQNALVAI